MVRWMMLVSVVAGMWFVVTQFVVPLWNELPVLPLFRRRQIEGQLRDAREDAEQAAIERRAAAALDRARDIRGRARARAERHGDGNDDSEPAA